MEDFHKLSTHNPRVQSNAIAASDTLADAVDFLRPNGRSLPDLFDAIIDQAKNRAGIEISRARLGAALSVLPTPIPIAYLASVCGLDTAVCHDLIIELTQRNVRLNDRGVELANEDFEDYCENTGQPETLAVISEAANLLMKDRLTFEYAATHLFEILVKAGRRRDLQACLDEENATSVIADPVKRRQVELSRIRAALHIAALSEDDINIGKTIYVGAESMPSAGKVNQVMRDNPDLSAAFVSDTIRSLVLNDPAARSEHGPLLMHLAAEHSRKGEFFEARMRMRSAEAWLQTIFSGENDERRGSWTFTEHDIVAMKLATFRQHGWPEASMECGRWSPASYAIQLRALLLKQISLEQGPDAIAALLAQIEPDYLFLALNMLVRAGRSTKAMDLTRAVAALKAMTFDDLEQDERSTSKTTIRQHLVDEAIFFLDYASGESGFETDLIQILDRLCPLGKAELEGSTLSQPHTIDIVFRAAILRARLTHQPLDLPSIYPKPEEPSEKSSDPEARRIYNRQKERHEQVDQMIPLYEALAAVRSDPSETAWKALTQKFNGLREHTRDPLEFQRVRNATGQRALEVLAIQDADMGMRLSVIAAFAYNPAIFTGNHDYWLPDLLQDPRAYEPVTELMEAQADELVSQHVRATEKSDGLIRMARMFLPFHRVNAEVYFIKALQIVEEVDLETVDVLHALCRMMQRAQPDTPETRVRASRFARLVHIAGGLLQSEDGFPERETIQALTVSCPPVAAATVSKWTDEGFSNLRYSLKTFTENGLASGVLTPNEALLMLGLLPFSDTKLEKKILEAASRSASSEPIRLAEEIARSRLLATAPGDYEDDCGDLSAFAESSAAPEYSVMIKGVHAFKLAHADALKPPAKHTAETPQLTPQKDEELPDWSAVDPCDSAALESALKANRDAHVYNQEPFFAAMRAKTGIANRQRHLNVLAGAARSKRYPDEEIDAILASLNEWRDAAVRKWRQDVFPDLIVELGYKTLGYDWYNRSRIDHLLEACEAGDDEVRILIVKLIESHAFSLDPRGLLKLLAHFVQRLPYKNASTLIDFFLDRLETRLKLKGMDLARYTTDTSLLPQGGAEITAALLYRYLGDIDTRLRWRAAHTLRRAVRIGANSVIGNVLSAALLEMQPAYTFGDCPFHSLSADQQLSIAIARLAFEAPALIVEHEASLIALWQKRAPHLLIGHYLSRALTQARVARQPIQTSPDHLADMTGVSASRAARIKGTTSKKFDRFKDVGTRFSFDTMDTIPYWYNPALDIFADLPRDALIGTAEKWIVEKWGGHENSGHWRNEPRRRRLGDAYSLYSNFHGAQPTLERHWHYLQWHGLFTAVGDLIRTYPLREPEDENSWNTYESWLRSYDTTFAGSWIADSRSLPPFDVRYWRMPQAHSSNWLEETQSCDLSDEILSEDGAVILNGHRQTRTYSYGDETAHETVYSKAAFVPSETAAALLRAFAATPDPRDVYLPDTDWIGRKKPDDPRFQLTNAITHPLEGRDIGLDEKDPERFGVRGVRIAPSPELKAAANLIEDSPWSTDWFVDVHSSPAAVYTAWSSLPNEEDNPHRRPSDQTYVDGDRLKVNPLILKAAMETLSSDLAITVHITRS